MAWFERGTATGPMLIGEVVYLRPPQMQDFPAWRQLREESSGFLKPREPRWRTDHLTRASFRRRVRWARRMARDKAALACLIFRVADDVLVGGITLESIRGWPARTAMLGYWIGFRYTRRGYMSDAVTTLASHAFGAFGLSRLEAVCIPENVASRRLLERCGFGYEGPAEAYLEINSSWRDHDRFTLISTGRREEARSWKADPDPG